MWTESDFDTALALFAARYGFMVEKLIPVDPDHIYIRKLYVEIAETEPVVTVLYTGRWHSLHPTFGGPDMQDRLNGHIQSCDSWLNQLTHTLNQSCPPGQHTK
jgi:hypothetical protein